MFKLPIFLIFSSIILSMIIGVITIPFDLSSSYISFDHIKMLEHFNLKIYPILYNTTNHILHFNNIDALYIPSGIVSKNKKIDKSLNKEKNKFLETCSIFINFAIKSNLKGNIFPIWGTCLGMETIINIIDPNIKLSKIHAYDNYSIPFKPTKEGILHSQIIRSMKEDVLSNWMTSNIELHNHGLGILTSSFIKSKSLSNMFHIISVGIDKNNKEFVSLIEGKKFPFYGVQWHPEVSKKTWLIFEVFISKIKNLTKSDNKKNKIGFLKGSIINCKEFSDNLYNKCYLFSNSPI